MIQEQGKFNRPADNVLELFIDGTKSAALVDWADANGLERAATLLGSELARTAEQDRDAFVAAFIGRSPLAPNTALRWFCWAWSDAPTPIRARFGDARDLDAGEAVMALHRRVLAGDTVDSGEWRVERRQLKSAVTAACAPEALDALLASMWDIAAVPGAIADAARTWVTQSAAADAIAPANWTMADHRRVEDTWDRYGIEHAQQNRRLPGEDDEAFDDRMAKFAADNPLALSEEDFARWKAWGEEMAKIVTGRTAELRSGLLAIAAA